MRIELDQEEIEAILKKHFQSVIEDAEVKFRVRDGESSYGYLDHPIVEATVSEKERDHY